MTKHTLRRLGIILLVGTSLAGCAVAPRSGEQAVGPSQDTSSGRKNPALPANPAVVALLDSADAKEQAGNLEQAGVALERALRLEPRNAMLWHRLARVRLKQGQLQAAVDMAAKSNSLAGENADLQAWNWAVIAEAKEKQGDSKGAAAARARVSGDDALP
jgi:predicted Zn-dependent protease